MFLVRRLISYEGVFDVQMFLLLSVEMIIFIHLIYQHSLVYLFIVPDVVGEAGAKQTNEPSKGQAVRTVSIVG